MFSTVISAVSRSRQRARHRRQYRTLLSMSDAVLRDIGLDRDDLRSRLIDGR